MKMKSQLTIAGLLFAGLMATGCSQQQAAGGQQQTAAPEAPAAPAAPAAPHAAPVRPAAPAPVVPKVKAKGNYKGPVAMNPASKAALQQYQK